MNIQEQLTKKQEELKKTIEEINQFQQALNNKNQEALRVDGAIKMLKDLIKDEESPKESEK